MEGMILKIGGSCSGHSGGKPITETTFAAEGQTVFPIRYLAFDFTRDYVAVQQGRDLLVPAIDYTIGSNGVVLKEGVSEGTPIVIRILRNVNAEEDSGGGGGTSGDDGGELYSKNGLLFLKHDDTGNFYRIGINSSGVYVVKHEPEYDSESKGGASDDEEGNLYSKNGLLFLKHDDTGDFYRIGINNSGVYFVKYNQKDDSEGGTSDDEPLVLLLRFTDEDTELSVEVDEVVHNIENATTNEDELTDDNYLFAIKN